MENKEILKLLKLNGKLLELHGENEFKIRSYNNATYQLDKTNVKLSSLSLQELEQIQGVGKSIAQKIIEITENRTFSELQKLLEKTPKGVVEMLGITGLGPKKVSTIWHELGIDSIQLLEIACKEGKIAPLKGFGERLEEEILEYLVFIEESKGKFFYADAEKDAQLVEKVLQNIFGKEYASLAGAMRRKLEVADKVEFLVGTGDTKSAFEKINQIAQLQQDKSKSSPFIWRGFFSNSAIKVEIKPYSKNEFVNKLYVQSCGFEHLKKSYGEGETMAQIVQSKTFSSEAEIFETAKLPYIVPELREGTFELDLAHQNILPKLIQDSDLKGVMHNHTTYSDGEHTLEQMAIYCKELGYQYLGITDHSKTANYAGGLKEEDIIKQHKEIDTLNQKLAPFKIFKGIESDILGDGSLDYEESVLKTFDFVIASVHANLKMDVEKATQRLITAIENPYTTMLGHPTGRLLLKRKGYPIDYQKIIDACVANKVIIEINANPWRLDLDWRWIYPALEKGLILSINPDAHEMEGYHDMHFGVCVARKGGLTADRCFNAWDLGKANNYLKNRMG
jgi:DNA polymerase (family 10)